MRRAAKADLTAPTLRQRARDHGVIVLHLGGTLDDLWCFPWCQTALGPLIATVDYKTPKRGRRTQKQQDLTADGWPVFFVATNDEVDALIQRTRNG